MDTGDLNRSRLINTKQRRAPSRREGADKREHCTEVPRPHDFIGVCSRGGGQSWKTRLMCH
jgi:hypothetical protein